MKKNLRYINITLLLLLNSCLFYDSVNEKPNCNLGIESNFKINSEVIIGYICTENEKLTWKLDITAPENSKYSSKDLRYGKTIQEKIFIPDVPGTYTINSKIYDEYNAYDSETKIITIKNNPPTSIIIPLGSPEFYTIGKKIIFDGSKSFDEDGEIVEYKWFIRENPQNSNTQIKDDHKNKSYLIPDKEGVYTISLSVIDSGQEKNTSNYSFYVKNNQAPLIYSSYPDARLELITVKTNQEKIFKVKFIDIDKFKDINFNWKMILNNKEILSLENNDNQLLLNSRNLALGDSIRLILNIKNTKDLNSEISWNILIVD